MKEYDFALIFKLNSPHLNPEEYCDQLYEAGCDDALIGVGKTGYIALDFIREADSGLDAIQSAINNVKSVLPDAELVHISPDLVGVKELANIFQCSRQNIQKLVKKTTFPNPAYQGYQVIWHLADVLNWYADQDYPVNRELLEVAQLTISINSKIACKNYQSQVSEDTVNRLVVA
ncbi:hypothetical protein PN462_04855 [Spirulina sp. CS-785/01]|uniref:helix-turn-helix transcriptional regulator n=1 Tax=Spirulina sp. CS-785/01 TaxID=3021716 RepID=UPI00232EA0CF|nr:hypothetical protein [Spirulina sp. CS-785/01]MDB9312425.1 hypothetical protein [Spirulina sp. CS-785/01]